MTASALPISVPDMIQEGKYYLLDEYANRKDITKKIRDTFYSGIEKFADIAARNNIERHGLGQLHLYFPVEKVRLLEDYLSKTLKDELYYWSYQVGEQDIGLSKEFFVDNLIMFRIHYPYHVAIKAKNVINPPYPFHIKVKAGIADLQNWSMFGHRLDDFKRNKIGRWLGLLDETNSYTPEAYHQNVPRPARAHGPHIDTWYGHSFDGINLWLAIDGVNKDNTVILYPEMFEYPLQYDPVSMYLKEGIPLTKPVKVEMLPGQLLIFNPEILHGTQVNISDETRIAITTRINPETPRFNVNAGFHFQHWHSSKDLEKSNCSKLSVFPATKFQGKSTEHSRTSTVIQKTMKVRCPGKVANGEPMPLFDSSLLPVGEKVGVDLEDAKILIHRSKNSLQALNRICSHRGIDLIDGFHDEKQIFCPGHGVAYSLKDGSSGCPGFKQRLYDAYDEGGMIYLKTSLTQA